jgi:hypothetical protein
MRLRTLIALVTLGALLGLGGPSRAAQEAPQKPRPRLVLEPFEARRVVLKKDLLEGLHTYLGSRLVEAGLFRLAPGDKAAAAAVRMRVEILKLGDQCNLIATLRPVLAEDDETVVTARAACAEDALVGALDMLVAKLSSGAEPFLESGPTSPPGR